MTGLDLLPARDVVADPFTTLVPQPGDALLGLIGLYRADQRPGKIDLGVGVFRDDVGDTPVMQAVKQAEAHVLRDQGTKSYLGPEGDIRYAELLAELVLGSALAASDRLCGVQTPGGTGALRLGAELLARAMPDATVWIGSPTWPNHGPILAEAGLAVRSHRFPIADSTLDDWMSLYAINVATTINMMHAALPHMPDGSAIICVGAASAQPARAGMAPYGAAKSGVARIVEALSGELSARKIRLNAIAPAIIDTPRNRADMPDANYSEWTTPSAIADTIAFLASPASRAVNGVTLPVTNAA